MKLSRNIPPIPLQSTSSQTSPYKGQLYHPKLSSIPIQQTIMLGIHRILSSCLIQEPGIENLLSSTCVILWNYLRTNLFQVIKELKWDSKVHHTEQHNK